MLLSNYFVAFLLNNVILRKLLLKKITISFNKKQWGYFQHYLAMPEQ
jgi:hypothetical protein